MPCSGSEESEDEHTDSEWDDSNRKYVEINGKRIFAVAYAHLPR